MPFVRIPNCGSAGVNKDLSKHDLPLNVWTDALNVRFLDGYGMQFLGHGAAYGTPPIVPYHVLPASFQDTRYWLLAGAGKIYAATITSGVSTYTDLTRAVGGDYTGTPNEWTSTLLSGIPIFNAGNLVDPPQRWDLNIANKFVTLDNWPANTYCKSMRTFKNFLIALGVTKGGTYYPHMVKWSSPADPGGVPATWDPTDATQDAGETDLAESQGYIIDGLQLRDFFMVYKEDSVWRMTYTGGQFVFAFQKVLGISGALNRNCIVELDGFHLVLTGSDVVVHDGQTANSVLDKQARRALFQDFDVDAIDRAFVVKNPFLNEVFICYASIGNSVPNKALVWNYRDKTVSYRDLPNVHHANFGTVDSSLGDTWAADSDPWNSDLTMWNGPDFTPNTTRVLMASADQALYLLDTSASFNGVKPECYLERVGLSFDVPERLKLVKSIRLRVTGNVGDTLTVMVGQSPDPYTEPTWDAVMTHVIGTTVSLDCMVTGRYIAVRIESGTAYFARVDSYDMEVEQLGFW